MDIRQSYASLGACWDGRITVESCEVMCWKSFDFKRFSGFWCKNRSAILTSGRDYSEPEKGVKIVARLEDYCQRVRNTYWDLKIVVNRKLRLEDCCQKGKMKNWDLRIVVIFMRGLKITVLGEKKHGIKQRILELYNRSTFRLKWHVVPGNDGRIHPLLQR